jgi:hypothetical protein
VRRFINFSSFNFEVSMKVPVTGVRFWLVVIVIGNEIFDRIIWGKLFEFTIGPQAFRYARMSVGRSTSLMTLATVNVFPPPVTQVCATLIQSSTNCRIAWVDRPSVLKSETN